MTQVPYPGQRPFNRSAVSVALFKQIHLHMDVRLALGWAGVLVAVAASLSTAGKSTLSSPSPQFGPVSSCTCLVKERTSSSSLTCPLFSSCVILTALQALYAYFVEADIVFDVRGETQDVLKADNNRTYHDLPAHPPSRCFLLSTITYVQSTYVGRQVAPRQELRTGRQVVQHLL